MIKQILFLFSFCLVATLGYSHNSSDAEKFIEEAISHMQEKRIEASEAMWAYHSDLADKKKAAQASKLSAELGLLSAKLGAEAAQYDDLKLAPLSRRKMNKIKSSSESPSPNNKAKAQRMADIYSKLSKLYGEGQVCLSDGQCMSGPEAEKRMGQLDNPDQLLEVWQKWRKNSVAMRPLYSEFVSLANEGSQTLGYADAGNMWRSNYDMDPNEFPKVVDELWEQVAPFYNSLHCYVRGQMHEKFPKHVSKTGPLPAHMMGNMWAQSWGNLYDHVSQGQTKPIDLTANLKAQNYTVKQIFETGENFFDSLGFGKLPATFWERSILEKPSPDHKMICHASAWMFGGDDVRIKMCTEVDAEDFYTVHHELGHSYYYLTHNHLSPIFRRGANDGFHEAVGDTISLSITPKYLKEIGLIDEEPDPSEDIGMLLDQALEKIAFLPFGLLVDKWRWGVFNGSVNEENYNKAWWDLRLKYQGVAPAIDRTEADFDPGAKFHIPANVPYMRYFLSFVMQFQFHKELCKLAGFEGPLHRCTIYNNKVAGAKLIEMLSKGSSQPWQKTISILSPSGKMDATAITEYFAPLKAWLDEQNQSQTCGW